MYKCKDCKYLDMTKECKPFGYVCTNTTRQRKGGLNFGDYKTERANACATGFEPREEVK